MSAVHVPALDGLLAKDKWLPPWLLYDDAGCALYERITTLPEYYLTRTEAAILRTRGAEILSRVGLGARRLSLVEMGAGTATKTEILLRSGAGLGLDLSYLACDIAPIALEEAHARLGHVCPGVPVATFAGSHHDAIPAIAALPDRQVLLFLGSSIGNYRDPEAAALLGALRAGLREGAVLLLGTDLRKDPAVLRAAYDDVQGITEAFIRNLLTRLNREHSCDFAQDAFRYAVTWEDRPGDIEIALEATRAMSVQLGAIGETIHLVPGERIHIETCAKYDAARVDGILRAAGFRPETSFTDPEGRYAVQLARVVSG